MGSTARSTTQTLQPTTATLRWRSWPLVDSRRWSWLVPLGILLIGTGVYWIGGGWSLAILSAAALVAVLWQFLLPVHFDVCALGVRRYAFGRVRLVPWPAIRAYQLRSTGAIFFQHPDPGSLDLATSLFVPYPADEDEFLIAVRLYLAHAFELQ